MVNTSLIEANASGGEAINSLREKASKMGFKNTIVLEELCVKDPKNFGKGYGKKAFLSLLKERKEGILIFPFSVYFPEEETAYAGRIKMDSMENMERGVAELREKFYKPLIKASGREFLELKTEGDIEVLLVLPLS